MIGLIILSMGMILMIYALRSDPNEISIASLASNGTFISALTMLICGITVSLYLNESK